MIFCETNFRNEIVWHYTKPNAIKTNWPKDYDQILFYTKSNTYTFNHDATLFEYDKKGLKRFNKIDQYGNRFKIYNERNGKVRKAYMKKGRPNNVLKIPFVKGTAKERTGYPTQKPIALIERLIKASSNGHELHLPTL